MASETIVSPGPLRIPAPDQASRRSSIDEQSPDSRKSLEDKSSPIEHDVEKAVNVIQPPPSSEPVRDPNLVEFDGSDDPGNPKNWSKRRKWAITLSMGALVWTVTFSSSIFSTCIEVVAETYNVGSVTATLGVALFVLGFVFGPIAFGPMSEVWGRRPPLLFGYFVFAVFQIPVAVAQNVETIMLGRFFGGFFASAPLAVVGGALADLWDPIDRAYAICVFAAGGFAGPVAGPIAGGFITQSYLGWRWTSWITLILAAVVGSIACWVIPETSAARILQIRAKKMRYETRNWALHAKADENRITASTIMTVYLVRPFKMIAQEPILALVTAYMTFIYGIVYLLFEAYPISFHEQRGWNLGVSSLPFVSFVFGIGLGAGMMAYSAHTNYRRAFIKHGRPIPEERLPPMIVGAIILPIGLFWFAWTSNPHIPWPPQVISSALVGMGCMVTFWQGMSYIIDVYGFYSNSAIAVNTFVRSFAGAGFPLFAPAMYHQLGVPWATTLLGALCVVFAPVPMIFYKYGAVVREKSRFVPTG